MTFANRTFPSDFNRIYQGVLMKLNTKLAIAVLLAGSSTLAQASTYNVTARFIDGGFTQPGQPNPWTDFNGSFDFDGTNVTNFTGFLGESMFGWSGTRFDANGTGSGGTNGGSVIGSGYLTEVYNKPGGYVNNEYPLLHLTYDNLVPTTINGNLVTATTFLKNSTDVVAGGGYDVWGTDPDTNPNNAWALGLNLTTFIGNNNARNNNGFFTLVFDKNDPTNVTQTIMEQMVYADETRLGMMGPYLTGWLGMTGHKDYGGGVGSMGGFPVSLTITQVAAVPIPAAAWLFGSAILGMAGTARRKKN